MDYILENNVLKLECTEKGGEMLHLVKKSTNHETLYQGDQGWSGRNPSLFPMVGNTYTKDYKIDGKKYAMKNHGLIRYATLKGESIEDELVFCLDANEETLAQYPFNFHFEIGYKLDGNKVLIQYHVKIMTLRICLLGLVCILLLNWMMNFLRILWHLKKKKIRNNCCLILATKRM